MPDVQIDGFESLSQMQLRVIIQAAALKPLAPVRYRPTNQIAKHVVIKMEFKRNAVVEAQILRKKRVAMHHACAERDRLGAAPPDEEAHPIRHCGSKVAEILLGQPFKTQL